MNISNELKIILQEILSQEYPPVLTIIKVIIQAGGRLLLVGGAVRDLLLGIPIKDLDIEVHGLNIESLEKLLKQFGHVRLVGKQFGVLRVDGINADFSLPRKDSSGRKPEVVIDPAMSVEDAFKRRDLTINAIGIDLETYELLDPFNGQKDLEKKTLRAVDKKLFLEDPLRFYRVMQFMARFSMEPDKELNEIVKNMDLQEVSVERIQDEFAKMLRKSEKPSVGIRWLKKIGRLKELFPELAALIDVPQRPDYHPEGDVFTHTMQAVDAAVQLAKELPRKERLVLMYAALCHDLGKPETTQMKDGEYTSYGHAQAGVPLTQKLLKRITRNKQLIDTVKKLVNHHMAPLNLVLGNAKLSAYKRLANKLAPETNIAMLGLLVKADRLGRVGPKGHVEKNSLDRVEQFLSNAQKAVVTNKPEEPLLHGRDIKDLVEAGPKMGNLLKQAYEIQLEEGIADKELLKNKLKRLVDKLPIN